jgi:membrane protein YdbS with pleckstrin-like domain
MLSAVWIAAELVVLAVAAVLIVRACRQFKRHRRDQGDLWTALEEAVGQQVGPIAGRLIVGEPRLWAAIFLWISGRSRRDARSFHYSALSTLGLTSAVVLGLIVLEGGITGFLARLTPWPWLSPVLIIVSLYAAVWIIGIYASLRAFPHLVAEQGLLVRYGVLGEAWIPWREVDEVVKERVVSPGGMDGLSTKGGIATLAVGGRTTVTIRLRSPGSVKGFLRETADISLVRVAADDTDGFIDAVAAATAHGAV